MAAEGGADEMERQLFNHVSNSSNSAAPGSIGSTAAINTNNNQNNNSNDGVELVIDSTNKPMQVVEQAGQMQTIVQQPVQYMMASNGTTNAYYTTTASQPAIVTGVTTGDVGVIATPMNQTAQMIISQDNFINQPLFQKAEYDENMQPWLGLEDNFYFACYTSQALALEQKDENGLNFKPQKKQQSSFDAQSGISVYHRKNSERLIIKKRQHIGFLSMSKQSKSVKWGVGIGCIGILAAIFGASSGAEIAIILGVICIIIGFILIFCCKQNQSSNVQKYDITVQSIPLNSIHYVDRELQTFAASSSSGCTIGCCNGSPVATQIEYSEITIGYNRSNVSSTFGVLTGWTTNTEDTIKLRLFSNHSYSLQQYLNGIMDGNNKMNYNNQLSKYINYNLLPTK